MPGERRADARLGPGNPPARGGGPADNTTGPRPGFMDTVRSDHAVPDPAGSTGRRIIIGRRSAIQALRAGGTCGRRRRQGADHPRARCRRRPLRPAHPRHFPLRPAPARGGHVCRLARDLARVAGVRARQGRLGAVVTDQAPPGRQPRRGGRAPTGPRRRS